MIRWCAYCQKFLGEREPRADFTMTHGVCSKCRASSSGHRASLVEAAQPIIEFYTKLRAHAVSGELPGVKDLLEKSSAIGISPLDLVAGLMQPLLAEIAHLQQEGRATIGQEHAFSKLVTEILIEVERLKSRGDQYDVLLACADGNYHELGVRWIAEYLKQAGVSSFCVYPSLPFAEVLALAQERSVRVIGLSVALPEHMQSALRNWSEFLSSARGDSHDLQLLLGGHGLVQSGPLPDRVHLHNGDLESLVSLVRRLVGDTSSQAA